MPANGRWDLIQRLKVNKEYNYLTDPSLFFSTVCNKFSSSPDIASIV
jgi:hypothetical protein